MNECCSDKNTFGNHLKKSRCPVNSKFYSPVKTKTILHHITKPWEASLTNQGYYFCDDPDCDVVYFGENNQIICKNNLRTPVWQKEPNQATEVCYCFGITHKQAEKNNKIRKFILEQTKNAQCACETRNPSGRCCLKDFID